MWRRREILGALGTGAAGMALFVKQSKAATIRRRRRQTCRHEEVMLRCLRRCAEACNKAFHHCIEQASAGKPRTPGWRRPWPTARPSVRCPRK